LFRLRTTTDTPGNLARSWQSGKRSSSSPEVVTTAAEVGTLGAGDWPMMAPHSGGACDAGRRDGGGWGRLLCRKFDSVGFHILLLHSERCHQLLFKSRTIGSIYRFWGTDAARQLERRDVQRHSVKRRLED